MKDKVYYNISVSVKNNLCLGCGICSDSCAKGAIKMRVINGQYIPSLDKNKCIDCGRCIKVCPGVGVQIKGIADEKFNAPETKEHKLVGRYVSAYSGFATDYETRYHGASGGLLTAFITFLLDKKYITAAVVAENDMSQPFLNRTVLVHDSKELYKARSSKYCPVMYESIIKQVKEEGGKVVIVGLPCIMQGFRKYEAADKRFREKVFGYFGLYCSCGRTFNLTEYVFKQNGINLKSMQYFQYRDNGCLGDLVAKDAKTEKQIPFQLYYHPLRSFFIPNRCQFCIDHYAELADVSFGDIHYGKYKEDKVGVNSVVVRNIAFDSLLKEVAAAGYIKLDDLSEDELVQCQASASKKKGRVGGVIKFARLIGKKVPEYDVTLTRFTFWKSIAYYLFAKSQMFVGERRWLWWIIPLMTKKGKVD